MLNLLSARNTVYVIGQVLGFFIAAESFFIYFSRKRNQILTAKLICDALNVLQQAMIGALTGSIINAVAIFREIVFYNRGKKKWASFRFWLYLFIVLMGIAPLLSWAGVVSLLPAIGSGIAVVAFYVNSPKTTRRIGLVAQVFWLAYVILTRNYGAILSNVVVIISAVLGLIRDASAEKDLRRQKMKILFFGDSVTDMDRDRSERGVRKLGVGHPHFVAAELYAKDPLKYEVINKGVGGNRVVDLYARIKADVWNVKPDVLSIMIGVNDVWHEIGERDGVDLVRFEKVYKMMIDDTLERFPAMKIILCEPCFLHGTATDADYEEFKAIYQYAAVTKKIAEEYELPYVALQEKLNEMAEKYGAPHFLLDGVHPDTAGAKLIADEWLKVFETQAY